MGLAKEKLRYSLNVTKSEKMGRVIVQWEIPGAGWSGEMDMTELVLMALESTKLPTPNG